MAKRIAFLSRLMPYEMFSKSLGIDYLSRNEFEVTFLDLSYLIDYKIAKNLYKGKSKLTGCQIIVIHTHGELDNFVKKNSINTIFIDFVAGLSEYDLTIGRIFRIFKKYNAKYYVVSNADIPNGHRELHELFSIAWIWLNIKKGLTSPRKIFELLTRKIIVQLIKLEILYPKPHRIFGIKRSPSLVSYIEKYRITDSTFIPINSRDYDTYLEYTRVSGPSIESENICVFLDEDHTNHPDFFLFGIPPLDADKYISSMNLFFDHIECITGLSVVIAAHPKSNFSQETHPFGDRLFIKGNTVDLIAKSKIAIATHSTSISFPVLFSKPIILVVTAEIKSRVGMIATVKAFARELDLIYINVDSSNEVDALKIKLDYQPKYKNFLYTYIKNEEPINELTWEIVAKTILQE